MKEIRMVDLKTQYEKIKGEIDKSIQKVIDDTAFIRGPQVAAFEAELAKYLNVKHVIGCANGTDALQISLMALGLQPGDEVVTSDFTFIATVEVIALLGLKPVIVDVEPGTFNINPELIRKAITKNTKAIMPVHLFGQCADMDEINKIAKEHNLYVIEDVAQAIGAGFLSSQDEKVKAGTIGDVGCTSFFPSKNLACFGDGGALFTDNDDLAEKIRLITNHGMKKRYYYDAIGVNSRLDTLQAAVLLVKLKHLDEYIKNRQKAAGYYDAALKGITDVEIPVRSSFSDHVFHQYTLKIKNSKRDGLKNYLQEKGVPSMIYYPVPLHRQNAFSYLGHQDKDFPVTEELCKSVLSLPMHTELDEEQLYHITKSIKEYLVR